METVKQREYHNSHVEVCRNCRGVGKIVEKGYDHGHGWSRDEKTTTCEICGGTGKVLVENIGTIAIKSLAPDEWSRLKNDRI